MREHGTCAATHCLTPSMSARYYTYKHHFMAYYSSLGVLMIIRPLLVCLPRIRPVFPYFLENRMAYYIGELKELVFEEMNSCC